MKNRCIYCNTEVDITESDIIPFALTTKKVKKNNVCHYHNARINSEAEDVAIRSLFFIRKMIGLPSRKGQELKIPVAILIDGTKYTVDDFTHLLDLTKGIEVLAEDGSKHLIGIPTKDTPSENVNWFNETTKISIEFSGSGLCFDNDVMIRMVAKIAYEWFCCEYNIQGYNKKHENIVNFIMREKGTSYDANTVEIITEPKFYEQLFENMELGSHSFSKTYDRYGNVYVTYIFMGIIAYKIQIFKSKIALLRMSRTNFIGYRSDGSKLTLLVPKLLDVAELPAHEPHEAMRNISPFIMNRLSSELNMKIITINSLRRRVRTLKEILSRCSSNDEIIEKIFVLVEPIHSGAIIVLLKLGENFDSYDYSKSFTYNLRKILNIDDRYMLSVPESVKYIQQKNTNNTLIDDFKKGIALYEILERKGENY